MQAKKTTQQVAERYYELAQRGQMEQIQDELYAAYCVSIEPENASKMPLRVVGVDAIRAKEGQFYGSMVEQMHGGSCSAPLVTAYHFAVAMTMDVTLKGQPRAVKDQLGIFEVRNGKIVQELFIYDDFE